jgi:hypothetical protein
MVKKYPLLTKYVHRRYKYKHNNDLDLVELRHASNRKIITTISANAFKKQWKHNTFPGSTQVVTVLNNNTSGIINKTTTNTTHLSPPTIDVLSVSAAQKSLGSLKLTSGEKKRRIQTQDSRQERKNKKINDAKQQKLSEHESRLAQSDAHHCPDCHKIFANKKNLKNHIKDAKHYFGSSIMKTQTHKHNKKRNKTWNGKTQPDQRSVRDVIIEVLQNHVIRKRTENEQQMEVLNTINNTNNKNSNVVTLYNGTQRTVSYPAAGFAVKSRDGGTLRNEKQLQFIIDLFTAGDNKKEDKITADQAHQMMKLYGTQLGQQNYSKKYPFMTASESGYPIFKLTEILTKDQIKSYFGMTKNKLTEQLKRLKEGQPVSAPEEEGREEDQCV